MNDRKGLNDETENGTTQVCADAETAQPASETRGDVTYDAFEEAQGELAEATKRLHASFTDHADGEAAQSRQAHKCQPWCKRHDPDGDICHAEEISGAGLTYQADEGHRIYLDDEGFSPEEAADLGRAVLSQVEKANQKTRLTLADLPPSWVKDAEIKGREHTEMVKHGHLSEMIANAHEAGSDEPALWLQTDPCPEWCHNASLHKTSDHPDDRAHDSVTIVVPLLTMEAVPMTFADGTRYAAPELHLQLVKEYRECEPRAFINDSGDQVRMHASLDELEEIANAMLDMVRQGRGA